MKESSRWRRRLAVAMLVVVVMSVLGCSSSDGPTATVASSTTTSTVPAGLTAAGASVQGTADASGSVAVEVPDVGRVRGVAGALGAGTVLTVTPVEVDSPPAVVDDIALGEVGTGLFVHVESGQILEPLTVTLTDAPAVDPAGEWSVVAAHIGDDGTVTPIPAEEGPDGLVVTTSDFSAISWIKAKLVRPIGDFMAAKLAGRTEPSSCDGTPDWASADPSPSGSTHACVRAGAQLADGTQIAELEIKSNRGTYQWVELPAGLPREYVWVEDQNDLSRALVRGLFGRGDTVLLGPGMRMTVGYRQPAEPSQLGFRTSVDTATGLMSIGRLVLDAVTDDDIDKAGGYLAVAVCVGVVDINLTDLDRPVKLQEPKIWTELAPCIVDKMAEFYENPRKAANAAGDLLGSDVNEETLTNLSQQMFKLGKFAKAFAQIVSLGTYILKEFTFITDAVVGELGATNAATVTLTLMAAPPPEPPPAASPFYGTWGVHGGTTTFRSDGTGESRIHDGFTDDGRWIDLILTLETELSADGQTLHATITAIGYEMNGVPGPKPTKYPSGFSIGDEFDVTVVRPGILEVTATSASTPGATFGNPYLCGGEAATQSSDYCGA